MKRKASASHDEALVRRLRKNPEFAAAYLRAALEDEDEPPVLLMALRHLAQAQGIARVAKATGVERESLYRALSKRGNPRLSTLVAVTKALGLRLTVEAAPDIIGLGKFRSGVSDLGSNKKHLRDCGR
jgi:probable addiction module antidote protein